MRDILGPGTILGYCTNVHAASNPLREVLKVKDRISPYDRMGVGIWLSRANAARLLHLRKVNAERFIDSFIDNGLITFTINGFPADDFHQPVVKHSVYVPNWCDRDRKVYTLALAVLLAHAIERSGDWRGAQEGSISTLPLGWSTDAEEGIDVLDASAENLLRLIEELRRIESSSGVLIHVDLEPEPGCILQRSDDVIAFFNQHLLRRAAEFNHSEELVLRHLRVCHDICHAAVMFEDQAEVLAKYRAAGIHVGKVQISNAIRADLRNYSARERTEALAQLRQFSEDRYLHQTMIASNGNMQFFEDLPHALDQFGTTDRAGDEWRVHFHVPIYLEQVGLLKTSQHQIVECLQAIKPEDQVHHFEVETYAWNVLPPHLRVENLGEGIARELQWVRDIALSLRPE